MTILQLLCVSAAVSSALVDKVLRTDAKTSAEEKSFSSLMTVF